MSIIFNVLYLVWIAPSNTMDDVIEFGFSTSSEGWAPANAVVEVTLWFNFTIYRFSTYPTSQSTWYMANKVGSPLFTVLGTSDCHRSSVVPDAKIMFEYNSADSLDMDLAKVTTKSGVWYGIEPPRYIGCMSTDPGDCHHDSPKHIWHFNLSQPNAYDTAPLWSDGANVILQIKTCAPTHPPTQSPTVHPTHPTISPTKFPTNHPSKGPTFHPTDATSVPSNHPTPFPTKHPSNNPTQLPTELPSLRPSDPPTFLPTRRLMEAIVEERSSTEIGEVDASDVETNEGVRVRNIDVVLLVLIIIVSVVCCCIAAVIVYWVRDKRKAQLLRETSRHMDDMQTNEMSMKSWLDDTVQVPNPYYDFFVANGYDTLEMVQEIKHKSQLEGIGIENIGHQTLIMTQIEKLRNVDHGTAGAVIELCGEQIDPKGKMEVETWLKEAVGLPEYGALFIKNGYETMAIVKEIADENELNEMGISNESHQTRIMDEVKRYRARVPHDNRRHDMIQVSSYSEAPQNQTLGAHPGFQADEFIVKGEDENNDFPTTRGQDKRGQETHIEAGDDRTPYI